MEHIQRAYGVMAKLYIELFGTTAQVRLDDLALIERHLCVRTGTVLDVGCGPGHYTAHLRSLGADAKGIDLVPEFIDHARSTYPEGHYELGSLFELPAVDVSASGILAWYSLIHIPSEDIDRALTELRRVLTPGGILVVGFFDGDKLASFDHSVITAYYWPIDELSERLQRAGFSEVERHQRPGVHKTGQRPHAAIVAVAT